jgi:hypothetical protein
LAPTGRAPLQPFSRISGELKEDTGILPAHGPKSLTPVDSTGTLRKDGNDGGQVVSDRARKDGTPAGAPRRDTAAPSEEPLYSLIRELDPKVAQRRRQGEPARAGESASERPAESGFFAQAARISMGTAFPALRSVARFLSLESYRSLPKHDKLPDLDDLGEADGTQADGTQADGTQADGAQANVAEADLDDLLETPKGATYTQANQLLDWDELEVEEITPTPYQRYLFELRIKNYLRQTKAQLSPLLLLEP